YGLNLREFVTKPLEFLVDLFTYFPNLIYEFLVQTPELVRSLQEPLARARTRPTLGNLVECAKPLIDAIGSAQEFPFPLAYPPSPASTSPPASRASTTSTAACGARRTSTWRSSTAPTSSSATTPSARSRTASCGASSPSATPTSSKVGRSPTRECSRS